MFFDIIIQEKNHNDTLANTDCSHSVRGSFTQKDTFRLIFLQYLYKKKWLKLYIFKEGLWVCMIIASYNVTIVVKNYGMLKKDH